MDDKENQESVDHNRTDEKSSILDRINPYSSLIVAGATIFLVIITAWYISESAKMRKATERMVETSIEQFKIRAYPTFMIEKDKISVESGNLIQNFRFTNRGEITAFDVSSLIINTYTAKGDRQFHAIFPSNAIGGIAESPSDYKYHVLRDTYITFEMMSKPVHKDFLTYATIFVRFKVPYDQKYAYEAKTYKLTLEDKGDDQKQTFRTSFLTIDKQKELVKEMMGKIHRLTPERREKAKDFFVDFKTPK